MRLRADPHRSQITLGTGPGRGARSCGVSRRLSLLLPRRQQPELAPRLEHNQPEPVVVQRHEEEERQHVERVRDADHLDARGAEMSREVPRAAERSREEPRGAERCREVPRGAERCREEPRGAERRRSLCGRRSRTPRGSAMCRAARTRRRSAGRRTAAAPPTRPAWRGRKRTGLHCEYASLGAGGRCCAAYSELRVDTRGADTATTAEHTAVQRSACPLERWLGCKNPHSRF